VAAAVVAAIQVHQLPLLDLAQVEVQVELQAVLLAELMQLLV
jgi:hypothetical protein